MTLQGQPCSWLLQSMFCFHLCLVKLKVFFFYIYISDMFSGETCLFPNKRAQGCAH